MRGGTVLHKGHLAPAARYSEDIDLVRVGDRPASHLKKALTPRCSSVTGRAHRLDIHDHYTGVRNLAVKSKIIRSTYVYDPWSPEATFAKLKLRSTSTRLKASTRWSP